MLGYKGLTIEPNKSSTLVFQQFLLVRHFQFGVFVIVFSLRDDLSTLKALCLFQESSTLYVVLSLFVMSCGLGIKLVQ